jgi:hypothetical protein
MGDKCDGAFSNRDDAVLAAPDIGGPRQLFTVLFIDIIGRVIWRWSGRSVPVERQARGAAPPEA